MSDLYDFAYELKKHQLRLLHPEYDEQELRSELVNVFHKVKITKSEHA